VTEQTFNFTQDLYFKQTFYLSKNPGKKNVSTKIHCSFINSFQHIFTKSAYYWMISVTIKTGVMMLKIQLCIIGINY